jgi:RyR domain
MGDAKTLCDDPANRPPALIDEICRVAHLCWSEKMRRDGWHGSNQFDAHDRKHDALVPFEQLSRRDRRALRIIVVAEEFERQLADAVEYERGPDRVFLVEEMAVGLRVGLAAVDTTSRHDDVLGVIVDWQTDGDTGELDSIRVRWDDGDVTNHHPEARELRHVD